MLKESNQDQTKPKIAQKLQKEKKIASTNLSR